MFQLYHGENKLFFIEIIIRSALYKNNKPCTFSMVLPHWNNSPRIHMLPHSVTLSRFRTSQILLFQLKAVYFWEAMNTNCIVFGLTRSGLEPTIHRTRGEHTNQRSGYILAYGVGHRLKRLNCSLSNVQVGMLQNLCHLKQLILTLLGLIVRRNFFIFHYLFYLDNNIKYTLRKITLFYILRHVLWLCYEM
jgi:hypothetical protein